MANKNQIIHSLKNLVGERNGRSFTFEPNTRMVLDYFDDYLDTELISLVLKRGVLYLNTRTKEHGNDTDRLSDFHATIVEDIYNVVQSQNL